MNLLKIFTYSGIIEVFVIPHILPCIVALIPSHITDMVELGVGIVSGLFPRVTVNVESEVFLRVWRDPNDNASWSPSIPSSKNGGNEASSSNISTESKSDNGSFLEEFCEPDGPTHKPPDSNKDAGQSKEPKADDATKAGKSNGSNGKNGQNKDTTQPSTSAPSSSNECKRLNCLLNKEITIAAKPITDYRPRYTCTIEDNVSPVTDELDTFCRSCSVEYHVKPPIQENCKSQTESVPSKFCKSCETEKRIKADHKNPQFYKSCSLEYVTKFDDKKNDNGGTKNLLDINENLVYHSLIKSPTDFKRSFVDREIMRNFGLKSQERDRKAANFSKKHDTVVESGAVKPIYFGDNYKNL